MNLLCAQSINYGAKKYYSANFLCQLSEKVFNQDNSNSFLLNQENILNNAPPLEGLYGFVEESIVDGP